MGLPHVRKSECEAKETDESIGESEQITLGNRIDSENECPHCWGQGKIPNGSPKRYRTCNTCKGTGQFMKES